MKNKIFFQHAIIMGLILFLTSCSGGGGGGAGPTQVQSVL